MTEWARLSEDFPVAAELTEQALYSLENSFHPMFSLSNGKCRLDYRLHENRYLIYISIFMIFLKRHCRILMFQHFFPERYF